MRCPNCGARDQEGSYCGECGAALRGACEGCDTAIQPGARYCTGCGEPVARLARPATPWVIAGVAVAVALLVLLLPRDTEQVSPPGMAASTAAAPGPMGGAPATGAPVGSGAAPPPLTGDMGANADRLFNRIMTAAGQGDRAEVARFLPMAIQAYESVPDLNNDRLYHLAILHLTRGDFEGTRRAADRILQSEPNHLLALGVGGAAAAEAGDSAAARDLYQRLLEHYEAEAERPIPEYLDHQAMLGEYRDAAREVTGSDGT